jgi:P27 family predicted phage terminase small subunit
VTRILNGNPSGRPLNREEPRPPTVTVEFDAAPVELVGYPEALAEWARLVPMLTRAGQITLADRTALVAVCLAWDQYLDAMRGVRRDGATSGTQRGNLKVSPYIGIAYKSLSMCCKLWAELGLTPTSRARLKSTPLVPGADPFAEFDEVQHA